MSFQITRDFSKLILPVYTIICGPGSNVAEQCMLILDAEAYSERINIVFDEDSKDEDKIDALRVVTDVVRHFDEQHEVNVVVYADITSPIIGNWYPGILDKQINPLLRSFPNEGDYSETAPYPANFSLQSSMEYSYSSESRRKPQNKKTVGEGRKLAARRAPEGLSAPNILGKVKAWMDINPEGDEWDDEPEESAETATCSNISPDGAGEASICSDLSIDGSDDVFLIPSEKKQIQSSVSLEERIKNRGKSFMDMVYYYEDLKGLDDVQVYKGANLDRRTFSKLRSNDRKLPSKSTALALAVSLKLNLDETKDLLSRAGMALSPCDVTDLIVAYFIENRVYDIYIINQGLYEHEQPCLGVRQEE